MMLPPQGEPIHDGGAKSWFGERCRPAGERRVGGDGDGVLFLPFGHHLKKQLGASFVEFHVTEFVDAEQIHSAVAGGPDHPLPVGPGPTSSGMAWMDVVACCIDKSLSPHFKSPRIQQVTGLRKRVYLSDSTFASLTRASENKPCTQPGDGHKPNPEKEGDCSPHTNSPGHGNHIGRSDKAHGNPYQGESESADVQKNERPKSVHTVHSTVGAVLKPRRTE